MNKKNKIPTDQGLQSHAAGINKKHEASVFESLAILDDTTVDPATHTATPSEAQITNAKHWVDENEL